MQKQTIQGEYRTQYGKGPARQLRRAGKIPGVLYSKGNATPLVLHPKQIQSVLHSAAGENTLITLDTTDEAGNDSGSHVSILKDHQKDPITGAILHADLFEISMDETLDIKVLIELIGGTPIGVKRDQGLLRHDLREILIRCLPSAIPDNIEVDASALEVGQTIHVHELSLPEGVTVLEHGHLAVISVTSAGAEEVEEGEEEEEAAVAEPES